MRKLTAWVLALMMLLPLLGASAESAPGGTAVISCPEMNFSTLADEPYDTKYVDGDGLYVYTYEMDYFPYILIYYDDSASRVTDGEAYMRDTIAPGYQERYSGGDGYSASSRGGFTVGGREVANLDVQYHRSGDGLLIYFLTVIDVRDDFTVFYRVRYADPDDREDVMDALDVIAANMRPGANAWTAGGSTGSAGGNNNLAGGNTGASGTGSSGTSGSGTAGTGTAFAVSDIVEGGMVMGRACVPDGWQLQHGAVCSVRDLSAGNPWQLRVSAMSPDGLISMTYQSARDFISAGDISSTPDGVYTDYYTPALHYMDAMGYCDYIALQNSDIQTIEYVEELTYPDQQAVLRQLEQGYLSDQDLKSLAMLGLTYDKIFFDLGARRYRITTTGGLEYYYWVAAGSFSIWATASLPGPYVNISESYILWTAPYVYTMFCPAYLYDDSVRDTFFAFMENTSVSDQFSAANRRLSSELWDIILGNITVYTPDSYSEKVMRDETAAGDDYDDRYTDYLFDQNDYTLSDGSHVKVSTGYDYVWEGDNGVVYYSDSAFSQPGGSTQLYPNR